MVVGEAMQGAQVVSGAAGTDGAGGIQGGVADVGSLVRVTLRHGQGRQFGARDGARSGELGRVVVDGVSEPSTGVRALPCTATSYSAWAVSPACWAWL